MRVRSRLARLGIGGAFVLVATACPEGPRYPATWQSRAPESGAAPSTEAQPASAQPEREASEEAATMHAWFSAIGDAEHAIVAGDGAAARAEGRTLAQRLRTSAPPGPWVAIVAEITREADALAEAEGLRAASASVARLARQCGGCHEALGVKPALPDMPAMPSRRPTADAATAMKWHGWAAERMWEGLVGPSDDRWLRGTATFVVLPRCEGSDTASSPAAAERCRKTRALAQRAHVAPTLDDRAEIYGELLATCADCHVAARAPVVLLRPGT